MFLTAGPAVAKINVSRLSRKPFALRRYAPAPCARPRIPASAAT